MQSPLPLNSIALRPQVRGSASDALATHGITVQTSSGAVRCLQSWPSQKSHLARSEKHQGRRQCGARPSRGLSANPIGHKRHDTKQEISKEISNPSRRCRRCNARHLQARNDAPCPKELATVVRKPTSHNACASSTHGWRRQKASAAAASNSAFALSLEGTPGHARISSGGHRSNGTTPSGTCCASSRRAQHGASPLHETRTPLLLERGRLLIGNISIHRSLQTRQAFKAAGELRASGTCLEGSHRHVIVARAHMTGT